MVLGASWQGAWSLRHSHTPGSFPTSPKKIYTLKTKTTSFQIKAVYLHR